MLNFLVNPGKNKKPSSVEKISASQLSRIDEICEEIKKGDQNYSEKTVRTNGAPRECKRLIKEGATPETLFGKLEESLIEQEENYKYYIQHFLPALLREIIQSKELELEKIGLVLRITSGIVKQSSKEECNSLLSNLEAKITESTKLSLEEKTERKKMIMELKISDDLRDSQISGQDDKGTPPPGDNPDPLVPSEQNPPQSPVGSSVNPTLNHVEEDDEIPNNLNIPPEEIRKKYDKVMKELMEKLEPNRNEDQPPKQDPEEKPKKHENENSEPTKQPNNRNFRIALATGCALSAIGCLIAGVVTLGMVGAGLLVMSVVLAVAAAVTRYLTPPSSELTSTDLSPLIDDSKQR